MQEKKLSITALSCDVPGLDIEGMTLCVPLSAVRAHKRYKSRSLTTLGKCKHLLSLIRQAGFYAKSCANRDAPRPYWMTQRKAVWPPLGNVADAQLYASRSSFSILRLDICAIMRKKVLPQNLLRYCNVR